MTFEIEVGGRKRLVSIEPIAAPLPTGGRFRVVLHPPDDGASAGASAGAQDLDVRLTDLGLSWIEAATGRSLDVATTEGAGGEWLIQFPHVDVTATVDGRRLRRPIREKSSEGEERVTAPMPGRIVRVLVRPGDQIAPRQGVVVIEAMKMENELAAAHGGRVVEVAVMEGMSVEAGRLLVRLEGEPDTEAGPPSL